MTSIPTILKGDDSGQITLALPEGRDFTGATLVLAYSGVTRRFTGLSAGQTLSFGFTHEETSNFKLGCKPVLMRLIGPSGSVETVENAAMKIKVTDCLGEVNAGGSFVIRPRDISPSVPVTDLGDLSRAAKIGELYDKVNEIVRVLAQRSLLALAACLSLTAVAGVQTARLEDLDPSSTVVTNVTDVNAPWPSASSARPLPPYLHELSFDDTYPDDAAWYYALPQDYGGCSVVRDSGFLYRNYDWRLDDAAEFVVRMSAGEGRFASVGVANCGTNLTEQFVTSGKWSRFYKCLPGRTVDGINENGVVAEVNVVGGDPLGRWPTNGTIHCMGAVRWVLDHATDAGMAASNLVEHLYFPAGFAQNFHWMVADAGQTWIVENGTCSNVTGRAVMTNFHLIPGPTYGAGWERYLLLGDPSANITNAWYTLAYSRDTEWVSEFKGQAEMEAAKSVWETYGKEALRGKGIWQTVHTTVYDLQNRTLKLAVQEQDDWYTFAVPGGTGVSPDQIREIAREEITPATNAVPRIIIGGNEIRADLTVTEREHYSPWTVSYEGGYWDEPYDPEIIPIYLESGDDRATVGPGWYFVYKSNGYAEGRAEINFTDRDALLLTRSTSQAYGNIFATRHLVLERTTRLSTTNDLTAAISPVSNKADDALSAANDANVWSSATHAFMTGGRTNCWWSGTNYVFGTDAATRHKFAWEDGMDAATVPCSMALYEIRDGVRECVWDQRDWTAWYWSFKARQMEAAIQERIDSLGNVVTNDAMYAWAKRYASDGVRNPDPSTTFIDTPTVTLSPGMRWETVATVSGAAYWTIVGDGAVIGGSGTNATLQIMDFEGNEIMTVTKGDHRLAWLERGEIVGQTTDAQGRVCFDMIADAQPTGHFSTTFDQGDFVSETSDDCPASYEWEDIGGGKWRVHFLLKPGIQANACFAKFLVEVEGQTVIRFNAGQEISGGLIYNGVKIAPDVTGSPAVGTVIQWKVVH